MANERSLSTRDRFLDAALARFSVHGWGGTAIRDLAGDVGIRESSVYKHFGSKQAIVDALLARADERVAQVAERLGVTVEAGAAAEAAYRGSSVERLVRVGAGFFDAMLHDPELRDLRRMLTAGQYRDPEMGRRLRDYWIERPLAFHADLFAALVSSGELRPGLDPHATALAFYGPVLTLIEYADAGAEAEARARRMLAAHIEDFVALRAAGAR